MVKDAKQHKEEDEKRRKEIDTKHRAEQLLYATEKTLNENREKIPAADASAIDHAITDLKSAIESNDTARIEREVENITKASHKLAEAMYQQSQTTTSQNNANRSSAAQSSGTGNDDVIDAEYSENA